MKHIRQRTPIDCTTCCIAMAAGTSYRRALEALSGRARRSTGINVFQTQGTLRRLTGRTWHRRLVRLRPLASVARDLGARPVVVALAIAWPVFGNDIVVRRGMVYDPAEPLPVALASYRRRRAKVVWVIGESAR